MIYILSPFKLDLLEDKNPPGDLVIDHLIEICSREGAHIIDRKRTAAKIQKENPNLKHLYSLNIKKISR